MRREHPPQDFNGLGCCGASHHLHLGPLGVGVDSNEKGSSLKGACKIDMYSLPWLWRPLPWVHRGNSWRVLDSLTRLTTLHKVLNILVQSRPPHVPSSHCFHSAYARMISMEFVQQLLTQFLWDNCSYPPEYAVLFHCEFLTTTPVGTQRFVSVGWPSFPRETKNLAQGSIFTSGCSKLL